MTTTTTDPRHFLSIQPMLTTPNHVGLKITSRSLNPNYTCEYPQRRQVAKDNFSRRKYQIAQCGYQSSVCKPYNELGSVVLDSKQLILKTLGQKEKKEPEKTSNDSDDDEYVNRALQEDEDQESVSIGRNNIRNFRTMEKHLSRSVKVMKEVKLGRSLFDLIDKEKQQIEKELFLKKSKDLQEKRMRMLSARTNNDDYADNDSDTDDDVDISKYIIPTPEPSTTTQNIARENDKITHSSSTDDVLFCSPPSLLSINNNNNTKDGNQHSLSPSPVSVHSTANFITPLTATIKRENSAAYSTGSTNIQSPLFRRKKLKKKNLPRPFSPMYTNLNFYRVSNSDALFRQLCVVNWILEAMSQDNNPPIMPSVSTCWNLRDLKDAPKLLQKRIEKEKIADPIWQSFLANPSKFQYKGQRRLHIPRMSIKNGGSLSSKCSSQLASQNKGPDYISEAVHSDDQSTFTSETDASKSPRHIHKDGELSKNNSGQLPIDRKKISNEEDNREQNAKPKHIHWNKIRASFKFESRLADVVAMKMSNSSSNNNNNNNNNKSSEALQQVPIKMREGFSDVKNEQAIILHDNLEAKDRTRWKNYEKKFSSITVMNNLYETLRTFREQEKENTKTHEEDEEKGEKEEGEEEERSTPVSSTCLWYIELIQMLPVPMKEDRNIALVLKKLKRFCDLEGRKISCSHFVRALFILRPFELCYPDISAAIEFVRDKVVHMDKKELEVWCKRHTKRLLRSQSAPPLIEP